MKKAGISLLIYFILINALYAADDWTQQSPSSSPSARFFHAMAYIGGDQVILFGGQALSPNDETWIYDLSDDTWTQQFPPSSPSARSAHAMAHIGGDQVVLFGGYDGSYDDETWIYDLGANTWTQQSPSSRPSARSLPDMAYIGGDQVMLFGGNDGSYDDETWIYDLSDDTWTQQFPLPSPSARNQHAMSHIGGDQVVLFGGYDGSDDDETWIYDLSTNTWTEQSSPYPSPSARQSHDMVYIGGDQVVLFGGNDGSYDDETWIFDAGDGNWTLDSNTTQPSPRGSLALSETSMDGTSYPVLFGGYDGSNDDETWIFGGGDYLDFAPTIDSIIDVPYDQGRQVFVFWTASFLDAPEVNAITHYTIWRLCPYGNLMPTFYPEWDGTSIYDPDRPVYRVLPDPKGGDQRDYWEQIGTVSAHFLDEYAFTSSTFEDSSSGGIPYFTFFVSAHTTDPFVFYDSDPDSGYSVDNVNPAPTQLQVQLAGLPSTISLQWNQVTTGIDGSSELGAISYRVYSDTFPSVSYTHLTLPTN